jgi:hypothetical protein
MSRGIEVNPMIIVSRLCRIAAATALLAGFSASGFLGTAYGAPPSSNKGGEVRGTARADERAGDHGDQGRDRAEANKTKAKKAPAKGGPGSPK